MSLEKSISNCGSKIFGGTISRGVYATAIAVGVGFVVTPAALAHHPFGSDTPASFIEGFLSGLGHPIIGLDHFAFVVAVGLLAVLRGKLGLVLPLLFTVATAFGTAIHLQSINLPVPEIVIAASVLTIGIALALQKNLNPILLAVLGSVAGLFHGFAYGEAIFGAEMTPVAAYLIGFGSIQLIISAIAFYLGSNLTSAQHNTSLPLRFAGCTIAGIGLTFLSGAILG